MTISCVVGSFPLQCLASLNLSMCNIRLPSGRVLLRLLDELDTYEGVDPLGMFLYFLRMVEDIIAPKLSTFFVGSSV